MLTLAELSPERFAEEDPVSTDDRTDSGRHAARFADRLPCELDGALHQRSVTVRVALSFHAANVSAVPKRPGTKAAFGA
jgi:hypothetical protein